MAGWERGCALFGAAENSAVASHLVIFKIVSVYLSAAKLAQQNRILRVRSIVSRNITNFDSILF
jgi:hypothetical protein